MEFIPEHLNHLPSHFRIARMNWLFPISITGLSVAAAYWLGHVAAAGSPAEAVGFALLGALTALALLEHWFMVLPPTGREAVALDAARPFNANPSNEDKRGSPMNFDKLFQAQLDQLKDEGKLSHLRRTAAQVWGFPKGPQPF